MAAHNFVRRRCGQALADTVQSQQIQPPPSLQAPQIAVDPSVDPSVANQGGSGSIDVFSYMQHQQGPSRQQPSGDTAFAAAAAAAAAHANAHAHHIGGQHDLGGLNGYPSQQ